MRAIFQAASGSSRPPQARTSRRAYQLVNGDSIHRYNVTGGVWHAEERGSCVEIRPIAQMFGFSEPRNPEFRRHASCELIFSPRWRRPVARRSPPRPRARPVRARRLSAQARKPDGHRRFGPLARAPDRPMAAVVSCPTPPKPSASAMPRSSSVVPAGLRNEGGCRVRRTGRGGHPRSRCGLSRPGPPLSRRVGADSGAVRLRRVLGRDRPVRPLPPSGARARADTALPHGRPRTLGALGQGISNSGKEKKSAITSTVRSSLSSLPRSAGSIRFAAVRGRSSP